MPWWAARSLADARRETLAAEFRAARQRAEFRAPAASAATSIRPVAAASMRTAATAEGPAGESRRAFGRYVGGLLIKAGTKLGGAEGLHAPELLARR